MGRRDLGPVPRDQLIGASADVVSVAAALAALAPVGVRTGCRVIGDGDVATLHATEAVTVTRAVPGRRREFATGRALLRELLGADVTIPVRPDRSPGLPPGVVGSLAHDATVAVAAVAAVDVAAGLGIDVEVSGPLDADTASAVLRPDEVGIDAHLAFTIKEAVYKAWSAGGGRILDHHEVRISLVESSDRFVAVEVASGATFVGRWAHTAGRWLALVVVAPS